MKDPKKALGRLEEARQKALRAPFGDLERLAVEYGMNRQTLSHWRAEAGMQFSKAERAVFYAKRKRGRPPGPCSIPYFKRVPKVEGRPIKARSKDNVMLFNRAEEGRLRKFNEGEGAKKARLLALARQGDPDAAETLRNDYRLTLPPVPTTVVSGVEIERECQ